MMNKYSIFSVALAALLLAACKPLQPTATAATPAEIAETLKSADQLTLVHVWATWCGPCRDEFPELVEVLRHFPNLDVLLLSADDPAETESVEDFLLEYGSPVGSLVSTELNAEFIEAVSPNWGGSLPATFFYRNGKIVREWEGKRTYEEYVETIDTLLNK